jgi:hypothetical protein
MVKLKRIITLTKGLKKKQKNKDQIVKHNIP